MSFIAGYLLGLGEGEAVTEEITIEENGEYLIENHREDPSAVGWHKVTANVPDRYDEGYNDGVRDTYDIINGTDDTEVDDPENDEYEYYFPGGAIPVSDGTVDTIIGTFSKGDGVYITNTATGETVKLICEIRYPYPDEPDNGHDHFGWERYNAKTGDMIELNLSSIPLAWGEEKIRVSWVSHTIYGQGAAAYIWWEASFWRSNPNFPDNRKGIVQDIVSSDDMFYASKQFPEYRKKS